MKFELSFFEISWYVILFGVLIYLCFKIVRELEEEQNKITLQINHVLFRLDFIMKSLRIYEDFLKELDKRQGSMPWEIEDEENDN